MTPLLFLTHCTLFFAGIIAGIAIACWAMKSDVKPERFWDGK